MNDKKITAEQIIKALEYCSKQDTCDEKCPFRYVNDGKQCYPTLLGNALDLINRKQAEIERLEKLQKPTETSGFRIEKGKVVFYSNILNGYRHEYKDLEEIAKELNLMLQSCYKCDEVVSHYKGNLKTAKTEAVKEFAERLKAYFEDEFIDNLVKEMTEVSE